MGLVVQKYGGTSVGDAERIAALAVEADRHDGLGGGGWLPLLNRGAAK